MTMSFLFCLFSFSVYNPVLELGLHQAGLELRDTSAFWVLGLKACAITAQSLSFMCLAHMYVCARYACLEATEVRRGYWILWNKSVDSWSDHVGDGIWTQVLCKRSECYKCLSHLFSPEITFVNVDFHMFIISFRNMAFMNVLSLVTFEPNCQCLFSILEPWDLTLRVLDVRIRSSPTLEADFKEPRQVLLAYCLRPFQAHPQCHLLDCTSPS